MQKVLIGFLTVTTLALGLLCAVQAKHLRAGRQKLRSLEEARAADAEAQHDREVRTRELERVNQRLEKQVQKFTMVTTELRSNETRQASNLTAFAERMRGTQNADTNSADEGSEGVFGKGMGEMLGKMMKDPAMREMVREQQKAAINMMYAGLFKELKMSPEEKEKFKTLLSDAQMKNIENAQTLFGDKKEGAIEETQKLVADAKKETDVEIKALLGDERFAQYDDYQKNIGERMQLDQFKSKLEGENMALQEPQMAQLLQIMKEEKSAVPPVIPTDNTQFPKKELFTAENLDKQMQWMEDYNRRVLQRAGQVLTPDQLKQYRDFQEQQASMQKLGLNMARQMFGGKSGGTPAVPSAR